MRLKPEKLIFSAILSLTISIILNNIFLNSYKLSFIIFLVLLLINYYSFKFKSTKRDNIIYILFSFIFSFFQVIGYNCLNYDVTNIAHFMTWIKILIMTITLFNVIKILFNIRIKDKDIKIIDKLLNYKYRFVIFFLLIMIAWLPVIISFKPGNFAYDIETQLEMITDHTKLSLYQPVIHTLILGFFIIKLHNLFLYTLIQATIMALIFAYVITYLSKKEMPKILIFFFLLLYMFLPTFVVMAITTTKDVLFSGLFAIIMIHFIEIVENKMYFSKKYNPVLLVIIIVIGMTLRNNMVYAIALAIPFLPFILKKHSNKIIKIFFMLVIIYISYHFTLTRLLGVKDYNKEEHFSLVVQQLARVHKYENLSTDDKVAINKLFYSPIDDEYNSHLADPLKFHFNSNAFIGKKENVKLYFRLFKTYPITYIDAWFDVFFNYFYIDNKNPDISDRQYIEINLMTPDLKKGYDTNPNKIYGTYQKILSYDYNNNNIILLILMNTSLYIWLTLLIIFNAIRRKKYEWIFPLLLMTTYFITLLLGPVAIMRYVFQLYTCIPLIIYIYRKINCTT